MELVFEPGPARSMRRERWALTVGVVALAGMAYCHIRDVGMKFDEHVYYMAALFCCNIAASLALLAVALLVALRRQPFDARPLWWCAGALALLTIAGFIWSRTIGFPQMADHIGDWDALGVSSLAFEAALALTSVCALRTRT